MNYLESTESVEFVERFLQIDVFELSTSFILDQHATLEPERELRYLK